LEILEELEVLENYQFFLHPWSDTGYNMKGLSKEVQNADWITEETGEK
jgi:hypothetical protein